MAWSRRQFIGTCVGGVVGAGLPGAVAARGLDDPPALTLTRLAPSVALVAGAGGNVVVVSQPEGLALVNGGSLERASELSGLLTREFPGQPIRVLFNTDWHPEHTGLNRVAGEAGARIVAHEHTKEWLGTGVVSRWQGRTFPPLPPRARPNESFYTTGSLQFGRQTLAYGHLGQAHTDGDIYVHLLEPNILVAGDVVTVGQFPVLDYASGGWIGGLAVAARTLLSVSNAQTQVVPGVGPVQARPHLQAEHDMLAAMRDRLVKMLKSGLSVDEMLEAAPAREFEAAWGSPELFIRNAYPGLWYHARELGGVV